MSKIAVIGGGIAGLSAAYHLSQAGFSPTIYEATRKNGGRTSSFFEESFSASLDNGQHILMGCYKETLKLFEGKELSRFFEFDPFLNITYIHDKKYKLSAGSVFYPFNLAAAILSYDALSPADKLSVFLFMGRVLFNTDRNSQGKTVDTWLDEHSQNYTIKKMLWAPLCIGAMNSSLAESSAFLFRKVIREIFFTGNFSSLILIPKQDLITSLITPIYESIELQGGTINNSCRITGITYTDKSFRLVTSGGGNFESDYIISTIPLHALKKIDNIETVIDLPSGDFEYSSILTAHIQVQQPQFPEKFLGFPDSPIHWVFRHEGFLSVVISDANAYSALAENEITALVISELVKYKLINESDIGGIRIIKEKRATFIPNEHSHALRLPSKTNNPHFFLAGDWTNTGLPATIESAALSGRIAAEALLNNLR